VGSRHRWEGCDRRNGWKEEPYRLTVMAMAIVLEGR
jgi:hypothetical protein